MLTLALLSFSLNRGIKAIDRRLGLAYLGLYYGFTFQEEYFDALLVLGRNLDNGLSSTSTLVHTL